VKISFTPRRKPEIVPKFLANLSHIVRIEFKIQMLWDINAVAKKMCFGLLDPDSEGMQACQKRR
jgi:hypothetical protein